LSKFKIRRCGLLGQTLKHSYSPDIHKAFDGGYSYELFEVEPENLAEFMKNGEWDAINVTIPYKQTVMPYCASLSPAAVAIGSVNVVVRNADGTFYGDNTDGVGFLAMLRQSGINVAGKKVVVLGSGGSSLTVCHVLKEENAGEITVISRHGANNYETLDRHNNAQVIVNTTPVGMYPNTDTSPIELDGFPMLEGVLDIIYNPARTRLLIDAEEKGVANVGGLGMLVGQAVEAAKHFSGDENFVAPVDSVINLLQNQMENIILVGMPGSGKSVIGHLLAEKLNRSFVDIDTEIEKAAGCIIPKIFESSGEEGFRKIETQTLARWGKESGLVIATGGGVVTRKENYFHLHQNGKIVFIERDINKLDRSGRPLSQGDLKSMYEQRLPMYKDFADYTVQNDGEPQEAAEQILKLW